MDLIELAEPVLEVPVDAKVGETARKMAERKVDVAVILDRGRVQGIFTEKDVAKQPPGEARGALRVGELMTVVESTDVTTPVLDAARVMRGQKLRHLALVDSEGTFVALVGLRRVLLEVMDELDLKLDNLERELMADGPGG